MDNFLKIERFSFGVGDRFAHQAEAQLRACMKAAGLGAEIVPVWNKSNREHLTIGSEPSSTRAAAAAVVLSPRRRPPLGIAAGEGTSTTTALFLCWVALKNRPTEKRTTRKQTPAALRGLDPTPEGM